MFHFHAVAVIASFAVENYGLIFTMWCHGSAVYATVMCHKSMFYWNS